jgi:predicted nucleotidyltransferase component of viral defense system
VKRQVIDLSASIRQRLLNIGRERGEELQSILMRYGLERFLYRLSRTKYNLQFVLKGAILLTVSTNEQYRTTKDLDLLGFGGDSSERLVQVFREICQAEVGPDGIEFDKNDIRTEEIRGEREYGGFRIKLLAFLGNARIPLQIDVGFGDVINPGVLSFDFPTLLDLPHPQIRVYPFETVIAEKVETLVDLGIQNSRMKDFFDLYFLSKKFDFEGAKLVEACRATFKHRSTDLPDKKPLALSDEFSTDSLKQEQWPAFLRKNRLQTAPESFTEVVDDLCEFLLPPLMAAVHQEKLDQFWPQCGPWRPERSKPH